MKNKFSKLIGVGAVMAAMLFMVGCNSSSNNSRSYNVISQELVYDASGSIIDGNHIKDILVNDNNTLYISFSSWTSTPGGFALIDETTNTANIKTVDSESGRSIQLSSDGKTLYMASTFTNFGVYVFDVDDNFNQINYIETDWTPIINLSNDGNTIYAGGEGGSFTKVDLINGTSSLIPVTGFTADDTGDWTTAKLSKDNTKIYLGGDQFVVAAIDGSSAVIDNFEHAPGSSIIARWVENFEISDDETRAYVTGGKDDDDTGIDNRFFNVVDLTTNTVIANLMDDNFPINDWPGIKALKVTSDNSKLFFATKDRPDVITIVDLNNNYTMTNIDITAANRECVPDTLELSSDESALYIGCDSVDVIKFNLD